VFEASSSSFEREEREGGGVVVVRDTTLVGGWKHYFLFEGSQAMPASPSDRGEVYFKVIEVGAAALERNLGRH
jgi:hypothetical protein